MNLIKKPLKKNILALLRCPANFVAVFYFSRCLDSENWGYLSMLRLFFIFCAFSCSTMASDYDAEDPNKYENFENAYPKNYPECTGQIVGMTTVCDKVDRECLGWISCGSCIYGPLGALLLASEPLYCMGCVTCASIAPTMFVCNLVGQCTYDYAKRSGRVDLTNRADFARTNSKLDPLSYTSCRGRLKDCCCTPIEFFAKPIIQKLSNSLWSCCLKDCLSFCCGEGAAEQKQED